MIKPTTELRKKEPSKKLRDAIHNAVGIFIKTAKSIDQVFSIGREEGFSDMEIGNMIRKEMSAANYDPRTIRRALPPSAKHVEKAREQNAFADKMSANEHENEVSVQPAQESDNDLILTTHMTRDAEPKAHELPTTELQQSVTDQSRQIVKDRGEFGLARISTLPEDSELLRYEIPIPREIVWQFIEDHLRENYDQVWINSVVNQQTGKILSLTLGVQC
ncbi:MAG: hypothetical protein ACRD8W_18360 [Nitrososphaeraceae archaeon]